MGDKQECAKCLFKEGYNCSQAVLGAFAKELGMDTKTAMKLASSFGGGMGRMREVCGAASALFMIAGLCKGYTDPKDQQGKKEHYALIQHLADEFRKENGSIICRELLELPAGPDVPEPEKRTEGYYKKRPCADICASAAAIAQRELF